MMSFSLPNKTVVFFGVVFLLLSTGLLKGEDLEETLLSRFGWRSIGPSNMSGRISDIEALDRDFSHVLVATASGGVFRSVNAGTTWEPIFDRYGSASIGDIAMFQANPDLIWVGTGEAAVRNSVAWGDGIYKSSDGGKTFHNVGLQDVGHIARVILHPGDENVVYVAAQGHLWGTSGDRGLFMTENGGMSWKKLAGGLPDDGKTGCTDLVMDPLNPKVLYAAFWERIRTPYNFYSGGPNGGIFKSEDGGKAWRKLENGFPPGDSGRIGLAIARSNPQVLMAWVEHGFQPPPRLKGKENLDYFDMKKIGSGIYRSENGGENWDFVNRYHNRPFYYSQIRINPMDDQLVYFLATAFHISTDGGRTLVAQDTKVHGDHHALWCDPSSRNRFYLGTDGGAALTHDHGKAYLFYHNLVASQFYAVAADMRDPFWIYGGLQDNGTWGGPSLTRDPNGILKDHWSKIGGGDGFHVQIDPQDWRTLYCESQGGNLMRIDLDTRRTISIKPNKTKIQNFDDFITKETLELQRKNGWREPFRFNWSSPILLSVHNPYILYFAGNHLFQSVDRGGKWRIISPDLTRNDPERTLRESGGLTADVTGAENYGTIVTVAESPLDPQILWTGSDDGLVQVSKNGGGTWTNVRGNIPDVPEWTWVSRVEASHFEPGRIYVTFDGHRSDDFTPWILRSDDFGETWTNLKGNLPDGHPIYVVREDSVNSGLLFAGSEFACFVSLDGGKHWHRFMNGMPTVAIHDLMIHPRDGSLIAGTHGRGIWICDDIGPLRQLQDVSPEMELHLFNPKSATRWMTIQRDDTRRGHLFFSGENPPGGTAIFYYLKNDSDAVELTITNARGVAVVRSPVPGSAGYHRFDWDLNQSPTEQQRKLFLRRMDQNFDLIEKLLDKQKDREKLEKFREKLKSALTDAGRLEIVREIADTFEFTGVAVSARLQGLPAAVGDYVVTLSAQDQSASAIITLRNDPKTK